MSWTWIACPILNKGQGSLQGAARRVVHLSVLGVLVLILLGGAGWLPAIAEGTPRLAASQASYVFSESLTFEATFEDAASVQEVILFFGREGSPLVRRVYPECEPSTVMTVQYIEPLQRGQFAPGTVFRYWWSWNLADGRVQNSEPQTFEYTDARFAWLPLTGERVDLYYYGREEQRAKELLTVAEETLDRLASDMGVPFQARVRIYGYASSRDMAGALPERSEVYDDRVLTLGVAVDERTLLLLADHRDAAKVVAHELSHLVVGIATDNPFIAVPRWLDEGLAMHAEGDLPVNNQKALEEAIASDSLISLRSMTSYSGQASQVDLFYGQAYSVVDFLLQEYGQARVRELLTTFSEGIRQDEALCKVYGFSLDGLEDAWRSSLGLKPRQRIRTVQCAAGPA